MLRLAPTHRQRRRAQLRRPDRAARHLLRKHRSVSNPANGASFFASRRPGRGGPSSLTMISPRSMARRRGRRLVTLEDAGTYITKLPKAEHEAKEWQAAMEALILVAELDGPTMFARIGIMQAVNRHHVREFNPSKRIRTGASAG